ncbi:DUF541 domain-containing protein [Synechococcales cyanobacterium C]|uniref:DUF541 domain-containing protein n=1 Tax=Petrachloros mirabilis ULC683 TaxID=2781853 RepID=A0A8K1ZX16_9CYAN|nr:SIMPL domain-containing protein [Petrachloros mirabilis]NCJ05438.1 DUF541 domain-containing protein [Petrachloros mirabilis ULC683]
MKRLDPVSFSRSRLLLPSTLGLCLALGMLLSNGFTPPARAQEFQTQILTVTGRGEERIPTTLAQVSLGVEAQGTTAEQVQQEVARRSSAVVELLRSRNVQNLETTGINLSPYYNYEGGRQRLEGYRGINMVSFRVPTERSGPLIDEAVRAGASRIDSVSFVATDAAIAAAQQAALRKAVQDAQTQANTVLSALNLTAQNVVGIQVNGASPPIPIPQAALRSESVDATTPVIGGEQTIQGSVTLQIRY